MLGTAPGLANFGRRSRLLLGPTLLAALSTWSMSARGAEPFLGSDLPTRDDEPPKPAPAPAPYALPWHLRAAVPASTIRLDNTVAFSGDSSRSSVSFLSASYRFVEDAMIGVRGGWVYDAPDRDSFTNLALSVTYAPRLLRVLRLATSGGVVMPTAQGGGDGPDTNDQKAISSGVYARSAMDNAMFSPNDLGLFAGVALACIDGGLTLQVESTLFQLTRVSGSANQVDATKTNTTWGAHVGYFLLPVLSVGAELRYQYFLVPPKAVSTAPARRDSATAELGARAHFRLGSYAFRPGVAYAHPLDDPMAAAGYRVVQVDLPFVF